MGLCATATALDDGFDGGEGLMATIDDRVLPISSYSSGFEHNGPWEEKKFQISSTIYIFFPCSKDLRKNGVEKKETKNESKNNDGKRK